MADEKKPTSKHANKTSWKPGQSGNPRGPRPKGTSIKEILNVLGDQSVRVGVGKGEDKKQVVVSRRTKMLMKAWEMACSGDLAAMKFVSSYTDGYPRQTQELIHRRFEGEELTDQEEQEVLALMGDIFPGDKE